MKRWLFSISLAIVCVLLLAVVTLAVPSTVTDFIGTATSSSIYLTWTPAASSNSTVIRHSTTTYPATYSSGTSTYNGTGRYTTLTGLTTGTTYYFSAFGFDGSSYGAAVNLAITTLPSATENTTIPYGSPSLPSGISQDPDTSGWSIDPLDKILDWFADPTGVRGGLGMPVNNVVMFLAGFGVTMVSIGTYIKWKSFFTSWFIALTLSIIACSVEAIQWIVVIMLLVIGLGVAALMRALD